MPRLIMLDLDGTLVDRDAVVAAWAADLAARHPGDLELREWLIRFDRGANGSIRDRREYLAGVRRRLQLVPTVDELLRRWPQQFGVRYRLDDEVRLALAEARAAGCALVVVSNGDAGQDTKIEAMGLRPLVDACVISHRAGARKPEREIFEYAARAAGASLSDAWMVGDDPAADIGGGAAVGAGTIWIRRGGVTWPDGLAPPMATYSGPAAAIRHAVAARR